MAFAGGLLRGFGPEERLGGLAEAVAEGCAAKPDFCAANFTRCAAKPQICAANFVGCACKGNCAAKLLRGLRGCV